MILRSLAAAFAHCVPRSRPFFRLAFISGLHPLPGLFAADFRGLLSVTLWPGPAYAVMLRIFSAVLLRLLWVLVMCHPSLPLVTALLS